MKVYLLIALALSLTTTGQLLQKLATNRAALSDEAETGFLSRVLSFKETWLAILSLGAGLLVWLMVLYYMDVSKATPFLSLGFILVTLISRYHLKEKIPLSRWLGVFLVTIGLWLVSLS